MRTITESFFDLKHGERMFQSNHYHKYRLQDNQDN